MLDRMISSDDHVIEPPDLWQRASARQIAGAIDIFFRVNGLEWMEHVLKNFAARTKAAIDSLFSATSDELQAWIDEKVKEEIKALAQTTGGDGTENHPAA